MDTVNAYTNMMKMFPEADTLQIEKFVDETVDIVVCSPMNMEKGVLWLGMAMIGGLEDAISCGYPIAVPEGNEKLVERISELKGKEPVVKTVTHE